MSSISLEMLEDTIQMTLQLASDSDVDPNTQNKLVNIFRQVRLSRLLDEIPFVAVGGMQGAGKTTFIKTLYQKVGISDWLKGNIGRGEQVPVFIREQTTAHEINAKRIVFNRFTKKIEEIECDKSEFIQSVQDWSHCDKEGRKTLFTYLNLPKVYGLPFGWMLLPGYEAEQKDNENWQGLMRYALLHAAGMVFVTDETRMAQAQKNVLEDIREVTTRLTPVIAISRGDEFRKNQEKINQLINRAHELYQVSRDKIIVIGTDFENWETDFAKVFYTTLQSGNHIQEQKLSAILSAINYDLKDVISEFEVLLEKRDYKESNENRKIDQLIDRFNEAAQQYKKDLADNLDEQIELVVGKAIKAAQEDYTDNETGLINNAIIGFKHITFNSDSIDTKREQRIIESYRNANPQQANLESIRKTSEHILDIKIGSSTADNLLGYQNSNLSSTDFNEIWDGVSEGVITLLKKPQLPSNDKNIIKDKHVALEKALQILPALSMEYLRLMQETDVIHVADLSQQSSQKELLENFEKNYIDIATTLKNSLQSNVETVQGSAKTILGVMTTILGADGLDGQFLDNETKRSLADAAGISSMAATRLLGSALVVAGAVLTLHQASSHTALNDKKNKQYIKEMLIRTGEENKKKLLKKYDKAMQLLEQRIRSNLQELYEVSQIDNDHQLLIALKNLKLARKEAMRALKAEKQLEYIVL